MLESQEGLKRLSLELDLDVQRRLRLESQEGLKHQDRDYADVASARC